MIIFIGLLFIPIALIMISRLNRVNTKKLTKIILNIILIIGSILYLIIAVLTFHTEALEGEILDTLDYFISAIIMFIFSPFLWIIFFHYCKRLLGSIRIRKNAKIKSNEKFIYYRNDLDKISPSIIMFTSIMDIDIRKSVSATILKLKLTGHIQIKKNKFYCTNKKDNELLESEKLVLKSIKDNTFDRKLYRKLIKEETIYYKYLKKNNNKFLKLLKMLSTGIIPVVLFILSINFDQYVHDNYWLFIARGNYDLFYTLIGIAFIGSALLVPVAVVMIIKQIRFFNKDFIRTSKGNELLTKAYALRSFLKDFSTLKDKGKEEVILREYYLIYAVILDVNVKIQDEIIEKYLKNIKFH